VADAVANALTAAEVVLAPFLPPLPAALVTVAVAELEAAELAPEIAGVWPLRIFFKPMN
jgi:hypothetical protein